MLAGYTAALIGFPAVGAPGTVFDVALARVEEITLGIVCATLIHSIVLPQSLAPSLLARLDRALGDARRWLRDALGAGSDARDRRSLAGDITELRLMATHLPFDTSNLRWTGSTHPRAAGPAGADDAARWPASKTGCARCANADGDDLSLRWRALLDRHHGLERGRRAATPPQPPRCMRSIDALRAGAGRVARPGPTCCR